MENRKTLPQIVFLRAVASLSVCLFHLAGGNGNLLPADSLLRQVTEYGYLGVIIFFVISGFIICYTLPKNYALKHFGAFITKRFVRIYPPYLASVILVILLLVVSSRFNHVPFAFSVSNTLYNLAYLPTFKLGEYYNPVYWSLGVEWQFYLLIGLLFAFARKSRATVAISLAVLLAGYFIPDGGLQLIFPSLPLFCLGIAAYFYLYTQLISTPVYLVVLAITAALLYLSGLPIFIAGLASLAAIHFWRNDNPLSRFFSRISYSLFLTHTIIGGRIINLGLRFCHTLPQRYELFVAALAISIAFAYLFEMVIEKPFMKLAGKVKYVR